MRTLKNVLRISIFIMLLLVVWFSVYISGFIISKSENTNLDYIPDNAQLAIRIDAREISESTFFSVLLESKDEEILQLLGELMKSKTADDSRYKNPGINFLSDIVIFSIPHEQGSATGILFNLLNPGAFEKNVGPTLSSHQLLKTKGNVGLILTDQSGKLNTKSLQLKAGKILEKNKKSHHFNSHNLHKGIAQLHLHKPVINDKLGREHEIDLKFEHDDHSFKLNGAMNTVQAFQENYLSHQLVPKGFHVTSRIFADEWADSLINFLSFLPADIPAIEAFSINFEGVNVVNHSSGFFVVPQMELIIQCEENFSISDLFTSGQMQSELDYKIEGNSILIQDQRLYFEQLSSKSFYLGKSRKPATISAPKNQLLLIDGELNPLVTVRGGWMTSFLEMIPVFKASKELATSSKSFHLEINKKGNEKAVIEGQMEFKDNKMPMAEVLRFLLVGQLVK